MDIIHQIDAPLSEDWLRAAGFKWHELERQGAKHWLLWVGDVVRGDHSMTDTEDLGIEVTPCRPAERSEWFCWLRADHAGRYSRFIHLRHLRIVRDLLHVIFGVTGQEFIAENCFYGMMKTPEQAERWRAQETRDRDRFDRQIRDKNHPWRDIERDDTRGRPLPQHMQAAIDAGKAK